MSRPRLNQAKNTAKEDVHFQNSNRNKSVRKGKITSKYYV